MPKLTTAVEMSAQAPSKHARAGMRVVMLTLDTHLSSAAQRSAAKLAQKLPQPTARYYVHLIPASQPNALALPGGHILVLSALLQEMNSYSLKQMTLL